MLTVGIIGATGYVGAELVRLLSRHPNVKKLILSSVSFEGQNIQDIYPNLFEILSTKTDGKLVSADEVMIDSDIIFTALPHGIAETYAFQTKKSGKKLIDMSADFRFGDDEETFKKWYKNDWKHPEIHTDSVYGLPEMNRELIKTASVVGNPGCYVTATTLALLPAIKKDIINETLIVADCKSGTTGTGREPSSTNNFSETGESCSAYGIGSHRHTPEIERNLAALAGKQVSVVFTPHLIPMSRGILATVYAPLCDEFRKDKTIEEIENEVRFMYEESYKDEPFVRVLKKGILPKTKNVRFTNMCDMSIHIVNNGTMLQVVSVLDNMLKGASGQAVHSMNLLFGFEETAGLDLIPAAF